MALKYVLPFLALCAMTSALGILNCKLRVYLARAEQMDDEGRRCWDTVKVPACGGRCDSKEVNINTKLI